MMRRAICFLGLVSFGIIPIFHYYGLRSVIEGDPAIYLTYAKTFFDVPFSFGNGGIKFGATSPAYLFIVSVLFNCFGIENILGALKFINLVFIYLSVVLNIRTVCRFQYSSNGLNKSNSLGHVSVSLLVVLGYVLFFDVIDNSARLYESAFVTMYSSLLLFLLVSGKWHCAIAIGSLSYLVRPELVIFQAYIYVLYVWLERPKSMFFLLALVLIGMLPSLLYHSYMYSNTGQWMPTSLQSRSVRTSQFGYLSSYYYLIRTNPQFVVFFVAPYVWFWFRKRLYSDENNSPQSLIILYSAALSIVYTLFVLLLSRSMSVRYVEFAVPLLIVSAVCCIALYYDSMNNRFRKAGFTILLTLAVCIWLYKTYNPEYRNDSYLRNRLAPDLASIMNEFVPNDEKIAIYEIQAQYYLRSTAVSLDARVGNELMSFLQGKEGLLTALIKNRINYISVDRNVSPVIAKDPFYQFLLHMDSESVEGDTALYKYGDRDVLIRKMFKNKSADDELVMWGTVFQIR